MARQLLDWHFQPALQAWHCTSRQYIERQGYMQPHGMGPHAERYMMLYTCTDS